jgi:4-methylaminobutanoate oxidase (formaldehyde-forming)
VTGGAFSARLGTSIGLCLITLPEGETDRASVAAGNWSVHVEGKDIEAVVSQKPIYDPKNAAMLG